MTWLALAAVVLALAAASMVAFALRCARYGRPPDERLARRGASAFLGMWLVQWYYWLTAPVTRLLGRFGVSPNALTTLSLLAAIGAGVLFWAGHYSAAGWLYLLCGTLDVLDGRLARQSGRETRAGAFFDSTLDRYAELAVYIGLLANLRHGPAFLVAAAALAGSLMTSYTKARGEALGVDAPAGGMQRAERVLYLGLAAVFAPLGDLVAAGGGRGMVLAALAVIALSSNWTALRRAVHVYRTLRHDGVQKPRRVAIP